MASLSRDNRKLLEKTVRDARPIAVDGATKTLEALAVHQGEPWATMDNTQRALRNRLRAHGRQLGDARNPNDKTQKIDRLVQEVAYEHWHRLLFARFLAENGCLLSLPDPKHGIGQTPISLGEVPDLAEQLDMDRVVYISKACETTLPQIFRSDDPVLSVSLPVFESAKIDRLITELPPEVFDADDSLGWVYQFWQSDRNDEINKSETKIGADELPAVTQRFTEDYMVLFLLHNTLGAWWAGKMLANNPALATSAATEDEIRVACRVGDVEWTYLRFVRDKMADGAEGPWRPAAGVFDGWPKAAKDVTVLDPCMGSGHFLVFALPILAAFRMTEEGLSKSEAIDAVLKDNLFGLEIDLRCTQIAAFNLAFAAWRKDGYRALPQVNLACSGLAISVTKAEWLRLAEKATVAIDPAAKRDLLGVEDNLLTHGQEERVRNGLSAIYDVFAKAPLLGSLIEPRRATASIFREGYDKLEPLLASVLASADTDDIREMAVAAQGLAKAAQLLGSRFTLVATNVPYLGRGKQDEDLKDFINENYPEAKSDIAVAFLLRMQTFLHAGGTTSQVSPQSWLYLGPYKGARIYLLNKLSWQFLCPLGPRAFETITGEIVNVSLSSMSNICENTERKFSVVDVTHEPDPATKAVGLQVCDVASLRQLEQLSNPDSRLRLSEKSELPLLSQYASSYKGIATGDLNRFMVKFWECPLEAGLWSPLQVSVSEHVTFGGRTDAGFWEAGNGSLLEFVTEKLGEGKTGAWLRGREAWDRQGIAVSQMSDLNTSLYSGDLFDENTAVIIPKQLDDLGAIFSFCRSEEFQMEVKKIDSSSLKIPNLTMLKVPFELERWQATFDEDFPRGLPEPESEDPSQWLFSGHPPSTQQALQVGAIRVAGYLWPRQLGCVLKGCTRVSGDGLERYSDRDGIVSLPAARGKLPAFERVNTLLADAIGTDWSTVKLAGLLAEVGYGGKSLDDWLRDAFFVQHCELFHHRPFIWHIWDGRRDGFQALVNYHRLAAPNGEGRETLGKLIYSYLGDWIERQRADQRAGTEGADGRLAHAEHLKNELIKIRDGEPPYDIFVRWKPLSEQPIGWEPDINDGVRVNIRPFMMARPLGAKAKNACILRQTPRISWDKDRGKEPMRDREEYPWFWGANPEDAKETPVGIKDYNGGQKFIGNRWNDLHYSLNAKRAARQKKGR